MHELQEAIKQLPGVLSECKEMSPDIRKLIGSVQSLVLQPNELKNRIKFNADHHKVALARDIAIVKKDQMEKHYFKFGEDLAGILSLLT